MPKNRKNRQKHPSKTPKTGWATPQTALSATSEQGDGHTAFAETASDKPILGSEIATREVIGSFTSLSTLPNPDPILRAEGKSISVYRSFVDGHLTSILGKRKSAVRARPWIISDMGCDKATLERLLQTLNALPMRDIIGGMLEAPWMGCVFQEIVWANVAGWIVPTKIAAKPQEWFTYTPKLELRLVAIGGRLIDIPPRKVLVTSHGASYLNPYGTPILSSCFWPLAFKKGGLKFWMLACEKFGIPRIVATVPASTPEGDRSKLLSALASMVRDAVAVIPNNATVTLLEAKATGNSPFEALIHWADSEMSKAVLGETLSTEVGALGVRGAAEVHNQVRGDLAVDDANLVEATMNQLITWIWELNRPGDMKIPKFQVQMPEDLQIGRIERDKGLYGIGARFTPKYFIDTYNLSPEHLASVEQLRTVGGAPAGPSFSELPDRRCRCVSHQFAEGTQKDLETLLKSFTPAELQSQVAELVQPIIDLAERHSDYAEFAAALDELFPHLTTRQMEASLEKCMLLSEMSGRMDASPT